jgi:alanyl-tRNA synthetase
MNSKELRSKYLQFFKERGHAILPSSSLVPENDPTTLFTSAGMQPMIPYLMGEGHPEGTRIADSQKSFRTQDIEEVGDNRHTTFFEMLGNWSLGDYFKAEQIEWIFDFLVKEIGLDPQRIFVSVFRGNTDISIPKDLESVKIWQRKFDEMGVSSGAVDFSEKVGMQDGRIFFYDDHKNWWSRSGTPDKMPVGEIGGPDSEMFWDFGEEAKLHENSEFSDKPCHINCDCGRFLEIGNSVFMEYIKTGNGFDFLPKKNVDFGGGLERVLAASNNDPDMFHIDLLAPIISTIEERTGKKYNSSSSDDVAFRVIADHLRAATFLIGDGVVPSNKERGYFVRRLIRRAIVKANHLGISENFTNQIAEKVFEIYDGVYFDSDSMGRNSNAKDVILSELIEEENKFRRTLAIGLRVLRSQNELTGKELFDLYQSFGLPLEVSIEEAEENNIKIETNAIIQFKFLLEEHKNLSRTASAGMFKGGLADAGEITTKYHTATHLLLAALRQVLGDGVFQKGSNITAERMRFDFSYPEKMTPEQLEEVELIVNEKIKENLPVSLEEMSIEEAREAGAMGVFDNKYGERVKVYTIGNFSKEMCGGPHVANTGELGHFKVLKEEASSAGIRRIKAVLE